MRTVTFSDDSITREEQLVTREWLVTAGNGSYGCGTLGAVPTRRHHGLLIANEPAPTGRVLSLAQLREEILPVASGSAPIKLWGVETVSSGLAIHGNEILKQFRNECGFPTWEYDCDGFQIEKSIMMPQGSKSVIVRYRFDGVTEPIQFRLRPMIQFRGHNASVATECDARCVSRGEGKYQFRDDHSSHLLKIHICGASSNFVEQESTERDVFYRVEHARGYDHVGDLNSSGFFHLDLGSSSEIMLVASADSWANVAALCDADPFQVERERRQSLLQRAEGVDNSGPQAELILAADQFLMTPARREVDQSGTEQTKAELPRRSVIAGYPWFTDWGRDTMISLPGLTLATNRHDEAREILLTFADYVRDGLIPNLFPEGGQDGMYHTADATLWFFQAIAEYERETGDDQLVARLMPKLTEIVDAHFRGTLFGIHVDAGDGLLIQGQQDVQLTWMDAKAGDWVVTPRRGKAVEINALWYNALHLYCDWGDRVAKSKDAGRYRERLDQTRRSFNDRFWFAGGGYLYDVVDGESGDDNSLRPNQLFAISLTHPVLDSNRWAEVLQSCIDHLLTPVGLRSLAKTSENYLGVYYGDVYKRDAAYHQGTVWSWLIGPLVRAWCRAYPDKRDEAANWIDGLERHLGDACIGQVSEIFAGDHPHAPKGCFAQAWGVAELLESRRVIDDRVFR